MDEIQRERMEMDRELRRPGDRPDRSLVITRRTFLHRSVVAGTAGAAAYGWFPLINTLDFAYAAPGAAAGPGFKFAWISDTHLYPKDVNTRFVDKAVRAAKEVQGMSPAADFLIFGGDLAQLGAPDELNLGVEILKEIKAKKYYIPGEHDWYLDMGQLWTKSFGPPNWSFDHKGVRFIGLDTVSRGPDYWTAKKMTPTERMGHMATLDGSVAGAWAGVGRDQLEWVQKALADWPKDRPVVVFSHNPLYEYYPPWNFWVRDWREVQEVLRPFSNVTNVHGHTHQVLYNEIGKMRSIGMLATSWPWPYAPEGVPALTRCKVRADPGDHFDGVGWSRLTVGGGAQPPAKGAKPAPAPVAMQGQGTVENEYMMWRKDVYAEAPEDSGCADNRNQILHPRIADQAWPYYGAYK
jgi:3',5'-cyclic AMP phosphodiesterase CpdA